MKNPCLFFFLPRRQLTATQPVTGPAHSIHPDRSAELTQRSAGIRCSEYAFLHKEKVISVANWQKSHINGCSTYLPITFENPNSTGASVLTVLA